MLIIARTDSRQSYGFDEAIARLQEAVRIGVDVVFLEALQTREEMESVCKIMAETNTPVLLNVVPGGVTPEYSIDEIKQMGFRVVIYPGLCIGPVLESVRKELAVLKDTGKASDSTLARAGVKEAFNLCGLQECIEIDKLAGGEAYKTVGE